MLFKCDRCGVIQWEFIREVRSWLYCPGWIGHEYRCRHCGYEVTVTIQERH